MITAKQEQIHILSSGERKFLSLAAHAPLQSAYQAPDCPPLLRQALSGCIHWLWRNDLTVENTILSPDLAPQWVAGLLALGAKVVFCDGEQKTRLAAFLRRAGPHPGKITAVRLAVEVPGQVWGEAHVGRTPGDAPIVAAIAVIECAHGIVQSARLALTGVWREHARLAESVDYLVKCRLNDHRIERVVSLVETEVTPAHDYLGSAEYRRALAGVLTRRALETCMEASSGHE